MILKIMITVMIGISSTFFFKKAAGTLSLTKLNIINFSYFILLVTAYIGGSAIYMGFRKHYIAEKIIEETAETGFLIIVYVMLTLPIVIYIFNRLLGIQDYHKFYNEYIEKKPNNISMNEKNMYIFTFWAAMICTISVFYTFYHIGYIALFELCKGNFSLMSDSVKINRGFSGNVYIRNILALNFTPMVSYFTYIYAYYTQKRRWKLLFFWLFFLSVLIKTYDFSKAPLVLYFFYFYIVNVLIGRVKNSKQFFMFGGLCALLMIGIYIFFLGYNGKIISFTSGPMSRIMITQIAGLYMHIQIFPAIHPYLVGESFSKSIALLLGIQNYGVRSGRVVMSTLFPSSVKNNSVGVMNTIFVAEAYANFGILGVIIAPFIVGFCLSVIPNFILKQKKTPLSITLYVLVTFYYQQALIGGFVDFVYNASLIAIILLFISIGVCAYKRICIRI